MAIRKDKIQLEVEINGRKAGRTYDELIKDGRALNRELRKLTPGTDAFIKKSAELKKVNDRLAGIRSQTKGVSQGLNQMRIAGVKVPGTFRKIGTALNSIGVLAIIAGIVQAFRLLRDFASESVSLFDKQAKADAQLKASIRSTNEAAGRSFEDLKKQAAELQKQTLFGDEAVQGAQSILLTFKEIRGETFDRTLPVVLDLATALKTDLKSASLQVGKALNDPVAGLGSLSRAGIQFTKDQKAVIKSLVDGGEKAKAQAIILKELESQFGGSAQAAVAGAGKFQQLANKFGDVKEKVGDLIVRGLDLLAPVFDLILDRISFFVDAINAIPAVFAGVRAVFNDFVDRTVNKFNAFQNNLDLIQKKLRLKLTFDNEAEAALEKEIAVLEKRKVDFQKQGKTLGQVFSDAYNEELNKVSDLSDRVRNTSTNNNSSNSTSNTNTTSNTTTNTVQNQFSIDTKQIELDYNQIKTITELALAQGEITQKEYSAKIKKISADRLQALIKLNNDYAIRVGDQDKTFTQERLTSAAQYNIDLIKSTTQGFDASIAAIKTGFERQDLELQNQLINREITQDEYDQLRQQKYADSLTAQLELFKAAGKETTNEALKLKNELDKILTAGGTYKVKLSFDEVEVDLDDIVSTLLDPIDTDELINLDGVRASYLQGQILEQEYNDEVGRIRLEAYAERLRELEASGLKETEQYKAILLQKLELEKEITEQSKGQDLQNLQTYFSGANDLLSSATDLFEKQYQRRIAALEKFKQSADAETEAGKRRIREEQAAIDKAQKRIKTIQKAQVKINLASEISSIWANSGTIPYVGQILAIAQTAFAVARAGLRLKEIDSAATGAKLGQRGNANTGASNSSTSSNIAKVIQMTRSKNENGLSNYLSNTARIIQMKTDNNAPVFNKPASSVPRVSGQKINVPENIAGLESGDNILAVVKKNEVVLNEPQQSNLGRMLGAPSAAVFRALQVPGFNDGGAISNVNTTPNVRNVNDLINPNDGRNGDPEIKEELRTTRQVLEQWPKTVKAIVVYQDIQEAEDEINEIRQVANL